MYNGCDWEGWDQWLVSYCCQQHKMHVYNKSFMLSMESLATQIKFIQINTSIEIIGSTLHNNLHYVRALIYVCRKCR